MKLVIVESPTKTKSLSKYLGNGFEVLATMGHMRDLPKSNTGIEIDGDAKKGFSFKPNYELTKGKEATVKKLKSAAAKAEAIILASDPDREGEAIAWHTMALLTEGEKNKIKPDKFERITFHSITKEAILEALNSPKKIDMDLVNAQQARRVLDRVVGYQLSPVLWRKIRRGLSAGRVQSVAVRMIVEREKEIEAFKPEEYWQIAVDLTKQKGAESDRQELQVELLKISDKAAKINSGEAAKKIVADLDTAEYKVSQVEKKERKVNPHPPFKTSTMQQAAANVLGWSAKKTMSVAQRLYELGVITYHRTDSLNLAPVAIEQVRKLIAARFGEAVLPEKANFYKTSGKVVAQEAHEAIRPTDLTSTEPVVDLEDKDEKKLYELIWRRTIACQMKPALVDQTIVWVAAGKYTLRATGETMKFPSWKTMYKVADEVVLPVVEVDEILTKKQVISEQKFTLPPARFNDASLIRELEKRGIGRPSTYAPTISRVITMGYVERKQRRFFATQIGIAVADFLVANFPEELSYEFTAKMEEDLDEIAKGKEKWEKVLSDFYGPFEKKVKSVIEEAKRVKMPVESTGQQCPECKEGEVVIRTGRFGKFYSCSRFPECKYTARLIEYVEGVVCEKCGGRIVVKKTRTGREFYGCENYPKCDWASWTKPKVKGEEEEVDKKPDDGETTD